MKYGNIRPKFVQYIVTLPKFANVKEKVSKTFSKFVESSKYVSDDE